MRVSLIVAVADNGVIGHQGALPWRLSGDLRYFKATTMGKPILMGRKTYESIGRPLPGRPNLVVSGNPDFSADGIDVFADPETAIAHAAKLGADELMVIGGAALYAAMMPRADRIYLTEVHASVPGDVSFPDFDRSLWREVSRDHQPAGEKDDFDYSFVVMDRVTSA